MKMSLRTDLRSLLIVLVIVLLSVVNVTECRSQSDKMVKKHESWMVKHGRVYEDEMEKRHRFDVFKENLKFIKEFNSKPNTTFRLRPNAFADLTNAEFNRRLTQNRNPVDAGVQSIPRNQVSSSPHADNSSVPTTVDWRQKGAVNPVLDQETCPVCWAYASASALESLAFIKTGNLPSLSVNQLVDCVYANSGRNGCFDGAVEDAYSFILQNGGIATEASYTSGGKCTTASLNIAKGFSHVDPPNDEEAVKLAVARQPASAYLVTGSKEFQFYSGGVFSGVCGETTNHFGVLIGYGSTPEGVDYWLMRNQWGTNWGEAGYIRLLRNSGIKGGQCQIVSSVTFPY